MSIKIFSCINFDNFIAFYLLSLIQFSQINLIAVQANEHPNPDGIAAPVELHDQYIPNGPIQLAMVTNNNFNGARPVSSMEI